ncbi:transposase [Flavobacterium columnare]|uniref:IS200/IS605 family transposase n=1 Tax=Flavobacterium columnare TaxID=996 RepID=A0AAI8CFR6_9FLAO|nr:IS200/IS605 family transposase [Flavobacterium columnare]AMO20310.1 IS200/IS605 family transposase [Flavobacterium columnare]ANO49549.1 transposase IS200-family protein [Flavobacterium columnare]APT22495.1 transposase [Flavobacterium columnare]AUX18269.1 transposase [Flavobacterium columnare]MBF6651812.1 transposase [Flavobacterium columnare]
MADSYTQIYIQIVIVVKRRENLIQKTWKDELYKYITGIITEKGQKLIRINGVEDHIHILISLKPSMALSDLVRDIKANSSKWINEKGFCKSKFEWQNGFGGFSYSKSAIENVINYIDNQEAHHKKKKFREEYIGFLKKFDIEFKEEYLFDFFD